MPDTSTLLIFLAASTVLAVVPGPGVLYIIARSVEGGRRTGLAATLGVATGNMVHVIGAAIGLSAIIAQSATAFTVIKLAGAAYLVGTGIVRLLTPAEVGTETVMEDGDARRVYRGAVMVATLNPKTALFFLAFVPQFLSPERGSMAIQGALLGSMFVAIALFSDSLYALASGSLGERLRTSRRFAEIRRWFTGGTFVSLGVAAAFSRER
jgi:threonine/homoserine/homoserine lactone efflux protein